MVVFVKYDTRHNCAALALSEFYGFARLGFLPTDVTTNEDQLKMKYNDRNMRIPEFVAGHVIVEVKRIILEWNVGEIVKKACQKAHKLLVDNEKVTIFHICYVVPLSMNVTDIRKLAKIVKHYTGLYSFYVHVKKMNIVFAKAPDKCFICM
tara:strand:- start:360 stop:812 length:453 start_codon:yes stop_codon:yes gene_type:complete